ncbi:hypothetical protein ASZ90_013808 [hydrocarbon metagenome]|uniref:Uncharacterized protein n=1 Tax=hydrocarbon metagenome TaxID=938273 RepID=A0A0W8F6L9_9ZZZZ
MNNGASSSSRTGGLAISVWATGLRAQDFEVILFHPARLK